MDKQYLLVKSVYTKYYRAVIGKDRVSKRTFRTATLAELYAKRVNAWYKNALLNNLQKGA